MIGSATVMKTGCRLAIGLGVLCLLFLKSPPESVASLVANEPMRAEVQASCVAGHHRADECENARLAEAYLTRVSAR